MPCHVANACGEEGMGAGCCCLRTESNSASPPFVPPSRAAIRFNARDWNSGDHSAATSFGCAAVADQPHPPTASPALPALLLLPDLIFAALSLS